MNKKICWSLVLSLILFISIIPQSNQAIEPVAYSSPLSRDPLPNVSDVELKVKILSDEEFSQRVSQIWGHEALSHISRWNKPLEKDLNNNTRYLTPVDYGTLIASGYWLSNTGIIGVQSTFTARHCTGYDARDAAWVGLGGTSNYDLIQIGINMETMRMFVEALPGGPSYGFYVYEGDTINTFVGEDDYNPGYILVMIWDVTTQQCYAADIEYNPTSNAIWTIETPFKPTTPTTQYHIGDFNTVYFTNCQWRDYQGTLHNMNWGTGALYKFNMASLNNESMSPSSIGGDGKSFSVNDP